MNTRYALCCAAILVIAGTADLVAAEQAGTFIAVEGKVEIGREQSFAQARVGDAVNVGDEVRTGRPGRARIAFRDRSTLNVADESRVVIDENVFDVAEGTFKSYLKLLEGKVRALVTEYYDDPTASYQIETATAVSGVRGTEFVVAYEPADTRTEVVGLTGKVAVRGLHMRDETGVFITSGKFTTVNQGAAPTPPRDVSPQQMRDFLRGLALTMTVPGGGSGEPPVVAPGGGGGGDAPGAVPSGGGALPDDPVADGADIPVDDRAPAAAGGDPVAGVPTGAPNTPRPGDSDDPRTPSDVADQPIEELGEIGVQF
jgi:hypothetical protein